MNVDLELKIISLADGRSYTLKKFVDYEIDCSLFTCDTAFAINLIPDPETQFTPGDLAELYVTGKKAATGRIEKVVRKYDKKSRGYAVYGRSSAAILIDNAVDPSMCKQYINKGTLELIKELIESIADDFQPRFASDVVIDENGLTLEITLGESYWDVLTRIATSRGCFLASMADGSIELRDSLHMSDGRLFALQSGTNKPGKSEANIISAEITYDETKRYKYYMVNSQTVKGTERVDIEDDFALFPRATLLNPELDEQNLKAYGELHKIKQIKDSMQYTYTVGGHDQNGNVWGVGGTVKLQDHILGIHGDYLITGTRFTLSKEEGARTLLTLSPLI
jgi:prophage tail gpP-like protein